MHRICIFQQWHTLHLLCWPVLFWVSIPFLVSLFQYQFPILIFANYSFFPLGMQNQFTPEQLGVISSSALAYSIFELIVYSITLYVSNITSSIKTLDLLAFSGYKFVTINLCILISIIFKRFGYYLALLYTSISLCFFLVSRKTSTDATIKTIGFR